MTLLLIGTVILAAAVVVLWVERARAVRRCAAIERDRVMALHNVESTRRQRDEAIDRAERAEQDAAELRATLDGIEQTRREAGFKAARTRKAREQAAQTVAEVSDGR